MGCERKILVFAKAPVKGAVKTRLSKVLGDTFVLELYKQFVKDVVSKAVGVEATTLFFSPPEDRDRITGLLGTGFSMVPQEGKDLGERMENAFGYEFSRGTKRAVLIGTDIPDILPEIFESAFHALLKNDAVIGPSMDGGYYLIGFNASSFNHDVFRNIPWSSETVFEKTLTIMEKQGLSFHVLPLWNDIDTPEDFYNLSRSLKDNRRSAPNTSSFLLNNEKENINHNTGS